MACISCNGGSYLVYRRYTDPEAGEAVYGASVGYLHGENHYREPIWSPNGEIVQYLELEEDQGEGAYYDVVFHKVPSIRERSPSAVMSAFIASITAPFNTSTMALLPISSGLPTATGC